MVWCLCLRSHLLLRPGLLWPLTHLLVLVLPTAAAAAGLVRGDTVLGLQSVVVTEVLKKVPHVGPLMKPRVATSPQEDRVRRCKQVACQHSTQPRCPGITTNKCMPGQCVWLGGCVAGLFAPTWVQK